MSQSPVRLLKVDVRVLQVCEVLGVREESAAWVAVFAKRLRGLGLAWHSFSVEECEVSKGLIFLVNNILRSMTFRNKL